MAAVENALDATNAAVSSILSRLVAGITCAFEVMLDVLVEAVSAEGEDVLPQAPRRPAVATYTTTAIGRRARIVQVSHGLRVAGPRPLSVSGAPG